MRFVPHFRHSGTEAVFPKADDPSFGAAARLDSGPAVDTQQEGLGRCMTNIVNVAPAVLSKLPLGASV